MTLARVTALIGVLVLAAASLPAASAPAQSPAAKPAPAPAPPPAATSLAPAPEAPSCLDAPAPRLAKALKWPDSRQLLTSGKGLPEGAQGLVTMWGPLGGVTDASKLQFRIFSNAGVVKGLPKLNHWREQHPMMVDAGASAGSYDVTFEVPAFDDPDPYWVRRMRSVVVVACAGDKIAAWGVQPLPFAPQTPAQIEAGLAMAIMYVAAAVTVFLKRREIKARVDADRKNDTKTKLYSFTEIKSWSLLKCLNPVAMTADIYDRGSLPKLQIWFFLILVAYSLLYVAIWQGELKPLTDSIAWLLGIPALGTLGAQATSTKRDRLSADNWAWLVDRKILPINDPGTGDPKFSDLIMVDNELDLTKLQALIFSIIVGFSMLAAGPSDIDKFQIPQGLLSILGLSQVVFVGGRFVKPSTIGDIDDAITELRSRELILIKAATTGVDVDDTGKMMTPTPPPTPPSPPPADLEAARAVAPTAVRRYEDMAGELKILLEAMSHRQVDTAVLENPRLAGAR